MTLRRLPTLCRKTTICKFNLKGCCTKGPRCNFAHSSEEVKTVPDLACTRLCDAMISAGRCDDPDCTFAHSKDELRHFPPREQRGQLPPPPPPPPPLPLDEGPPQKQADAAAPFKFLLNLGSAIKEANDSDTASTYAPDTFTDYTWSRQVSDEASDDEFIPEETPAEIPEEEPEEASQGAAAVRPDADTQPKMKLMHKLRRTRMCIFYAEGSCKKGRKCSFAHNEQELKPKPELACTKICPKLLKHGNCKDRGCSYAHSQDELQSAGDEPESTKMYTEFLKDDMRKDLGRAHGRNKIQPADDKPNWGEERADETVPRPQQPRPSPRDGTVQELSFRIPASSIDVKHTFIHFLTTSEEEDRAIALRSRGRSMPAALLREGDKGADPAKAYYISAPGPGTRDGGPPGIGGAPADFAPLGEAVTPSAPPVRKPMSLSLAAELPTPSPPTPSTPPARKSSKQSLAWSGAGAGLGAPLLAYTVPPAPAAPICWPPPALAPARTRPSPSWK